MHIKINTDSLPQEIIFCRHAESTGNAKGRDDFSDDTTPNHEFNLTEKGFRQIAQAKVFLEKYFPEGFQEYYISTFHRTNVTFEGIFGTTITPFEDPRLDEWWKGIFHSLSKEQIAEHYPTEAAILKREGWYHYRPPQGEAGKDVELRIISFLQSLHPTQRIFICGHGRWYGFLERILLYLSRNDLRKDPPENVSIIKFTKHNNKYLSQTLFVPS